MSKLVNVLIVFVKTWRREDMHFVHSVRRYSNYRLNERTK